MRLFTEQFAEHLTNVVGAINERGLQNFLHSIHVDSPGLGGGINSQTTTIVIWKVGSYPEYLHFCEKMNSRYGFERYKPWPPEEFFAYKNLPTIGQGF